MLLDFRDSNWIDATERLIQHHELWICDQRPGDRQSTFFTTAQREGLILGKVINPKLPEQLVAAPVSFTARNSECLQDGQNILFDG